MPPQDDPVDALAPWFHNLHLPDGRQTRPDHPLGDFPAFKWRQIAATLPDDLRGLTALDVGCNAGFYSFELARRGAEVLAIDVDGHYLAQAHWACGRFGLTGSVTFRQRSVYALRALDRTFDLVLFLGVLYHLRHPLLALEIVAEKVRGTLFLQTMTLPGGGAAPIDPGLEGRARLTADWPSLAFVEGRLAGDPSNWWVPNEGCVEAMIRSAGLTAIERPGHEIWRCARAAASDPVLAGLADEERRAVWSAW